MFPVVRRSSWTSRRRRGASGSGRWERGAVTLAMAFVAFQLGAVAAGSVPVFHFMAIAVAAALLMLALLGRERTAVATLMVAFATAPMYKYFAASPSSQMTLTDICLAIGLMLLLPSLLERRVELPATYLAGVIGLLVFGLIGSSRSASPSLSVVILFLMLMVVFVLPTAIVLWSPSSRVLRCLAWSYVAGHMLSTAVALSEGAGANGRYDGLTHHPNYFGQAGMMSIALLLFLFYERPSLRHRIIVLAAGGIAFQSVLMSGSRGATIVVAVLFLMVPVVERSAISAFLVAIVGALVTVVLPYAVDFAGDESSLARLTGQANTSFADDSREGGLRAGWERFLDAPFSGSGFIDIQHIHNNYLEIAVAAGAVGFLAYVAILFALARPLFGTGGDRRLCYAAWAMIGFGVTTPSLSDRSTWLPAALSIVAVGSFVQAQREARRTADSEPIRSAPRPVSTAEGVF